MIPRLKGVIAHGHDTKPQREDGDGAIVGSGTRPSPKAKPFKEDSRDTPTHGWGNKPNPKKDPAPAHGWGNKPNPKKESHIYWRGSRSQP